MYPQAIEVLQKRIMDKPTDVEAQFLLGKCFLHEGSYSLAEERVEAVSNLSSKYNSRIAAVHKNEADSALNSGNESVAKRLFLNAMQDDRSLKSKATTFSLELGDRASGSRGQNYRALTKSRPVNTSVSFVGAENPKSSCRAKVWIDKAVYKRGKSVRVHVRSDLPGYLYLVDIDSRGNQTLLLPNAFSKNPVFLEAGETFTFPRSWYVAGEPTGRGYIKAVVSPRGFWSWRTQISKSLTHAHPFAAWTTRPHEQLS